MSTLISYGTAINSVFQLMGDKENDITKSIAWAMTKCPVFLKRFISIVMSLDILPEEVSIYFQKYNDESGITDIEITDGKLFYIIIEAKRGWLLPEREQLTKYAYSKDIVKSKAVNKAIISGELAIDFI